MEDGVYGILLNELWQETASLDHGVS